MKIKTNKVDVEVPTWLVLVLALIADSMYTNHCRKSALLKILNSNDQLND